VTIPDPGATAVLVRQDLYPDGQRDGDFPFLVEKPIGTAPGGATGMLQILIDGSPLALVPYAF
ncbi:MAG: hypothetical protein O7B99_12260, partial [Planctomycetota bacterium]|nr:hypothetical protein [Planctomycetota bacterium]